MAEFSLSLFLFISLQAIMQEALAEKSHLVVLLNLHDAADICSLVDAIAGLNSFEVDATLVLYKSPHASNQELISSSTLAFNSKLLVVDLCDLSSRKDIVWYALLLSLSKLLFTALLFLF